MGMRPALTLMAAFFACVMLAIQVVVERGTAQVSGVEDVFAAF